MNTLKIKVKRFPQFWVDEITVRTYQDEFLINCNHANAKTIKESIEYARPNQPDLVALVEMIVCDKCPAWSYDGVEWHDE